METKTYRLGDVLINYDYLRKPLSSMERESFKGEYPYYGAQGIIDYVKDYLCDGEYMLIAEDGENLSSRKEPIANIALGKFWVNNHAHIVKTNELADFKYVYYLLNYSDITGYVTGSAQPKLSQGNLNKIKIQLPPLPTQHRIASILSTYDALIQNYKRQIAALQSAASELYKEWFVRFRFPGYKNAKFDNGLPEGWKVARIGEYVKIKSGFAFKSEWWQNEGCPVVKIKDIDNGEVDTTNFDYVSEEFAKKAKDFLLKEGDLVIAMTGATIGKIGIVPKIEKLYTNQRVGKFFLGNEPYKKMPLLYCLFSQQSTIETINCLSGASSAQPNISPDQLESIKFFYNTEIVSEFNNKCEPIFKKINQLRQQITNLTTQRDLLLPRLMSGKLSVE